MLGRAGQGSRGLNSGAGRFVAHLLSLLRPVLGAAILAILAAGTRESALVLSLALVACMTDYVDGPLARWSGSEGAVGRVLDSVCDAGFLALVLAGMASAHVWSGANSNAAPAWRILDLLPLAALAISFNIYLVRMLVQQRRGQVPARTKHGHRAGIANYALVLVGAMSMWPELTLPRRFLEFCCVAVAALNLAAVRENVVLLFPPVTPGPTMRS